MISRIQALVRSYIERKKYKSRMMAINSRIKYFKAEESSETVSRRMFKQNEPLKTKKYVYSTGAVYDGTWKGGLRHGIGTMKWPDGASYTGKWEFN